LKWYKRHHNDFENLRKDCHDDDNLINKLDVITEKLDDIMRDVEDEYPDFYLVEGNEISED
jgi:uncharacterized protein with HEPN domain